MKRRGPTLTPRGWLALLTGLLALVALTAAAHPLSIWSVTQ